MDFGNQSLIAVFFKAFALVFASVYMIFVIVIFRQSQVMTRTVKSSVSSLILLISLIQIFLAAALIILAFYV